MASRKPREKAWSVIPIEVWDGIRQADFVISRKATYHHAGPALRFDSSILTDLEKGIRAVGEIACITRKRKGLKYGADPEFFNKSLRLALKAQPGWTFEATVNYGVIYDQQTQGRVEGFDVARYDVAHNLAKFWSFCFGERAHHRGSHIWEEENRKRDHWKVAAADLVTRKSPIGQDLVVEKERPTVFGEIQCGNWALVYRDFLKLLAARAQLPVDLFLYVVPDGDFSALMSDGTVSFEQTNQFLTQFEDVLTVPTLVVGVDVQKVGARKSALPTDMVERHRRRVTVASEEPGAPLPLEDFQVDQSKA